MFALHVPGLCFRKYCESIPCLEVLNMPIDGVKKYVQEINNSQITNFKENQDVYVNIRSLGKPLWYSKLELPNYSSLNYMMKGKVVKISKNQLKAFIKFEYYSDSFQFTSSMLKWYVLSDMPSMREGFVEITDRFLQQYPKLKG
jgi:hypothetical protein